LIHIMKMNPPDTKQSPVEIQFALKKNVYFDSVSIVVVPLFVQNKIHKKMTNL
jgi:hypothetical protein